MNDAAAFSRMCRFGEHGATTMQRVSPLLHLHARRDRGRVEGGVTPCHGSHARAVHTPLCMRDGLTGALQQTHHLLEGSAWLTGVHYTPLDPLPLLVSIQSSLTFHNLPV